MSEDVYIHGLSTKDCASLGDYIRGHYINARVVNGIDADTRAYIMLDMADVPLLHIRAIRNQNMTCWSITEFPDDGVGEWKMQLLDKVDIQVLYGLVEKYDKEVLNIGGGWDPRGPTPYDRDRDPWEPLPLPADYGEF